MQISKNSLMTQSRYHKSSETHKIPTMKKIYRCLSVLIILLSLFLCQQIIVNARQNQDDKIDEAELNHIRYGLLSIDTWKVQLSYIVTDEIDKLDIVKSHQKGLKKTLEAQLNVLIDKINLRIKESNKGTAKGWFKQKFINIFVSIDEIKKGIPGYADAMIAEMKKPQAQQRVKTLLKDKVNGYILNTFDMQDMSQINRILLRTTAISVEDARHKLAADIAYNYRLIENESFTLIILSIFLFAVPLMKKEVISPFEYFTLVTILLILLITGVTTPMIDMEAKISKMTFVLLNHPINFENQVLFFQSKSVLDVFWIMITNSSIMMKFVGVLMVCFSIVFPIIKLSSSVAYYYNFRNARKKGWINFFVLRSGKWSMADVMVVAIFMAYIGFNGIITSQFGKLKNASEELVILTTNGTSLQPGYYIFLSYALLAMGLSVLLHRQEESEKRDLPTSTSF
jgi:hypothetical protein